MGQYHLITNLDRREFLHPHGLGHGLKLWEFIPSGIGPMQALGLLLACSNNRGGGDFSSKWHGQGEDLSPEVTDFIGRWAGDRIAIVGDCAQDGDTGRPYDEAEDIYSLCTSEEKRADVQRWRASNGQEPFPDHKWFTDITPLARQAMSEVFGLAYHGDGWLHYTGGLAEERDAELCYCRDRRSA